MKTMIVIPARLHSTRLPEKMLLEETGKPLIQHTWEQARQSKLADRILVATDSERIATAVAAFGGDCMMTRPDHESGSDRIAEVARQFTEFDLLVNVQGDEPEIRPADIDTAIELVHKQPDTDIGTLACPMTDPARIADPSIVKVVFDSTMRAMYFSRYPIPFLRPGQESGLPPQTYLWHQHLGIYVYRRESLLEMTSLPRPAIEIAESLEQLRALHFGKRIRVGIVAESSPGIDTRGDYEAFVRRNRR
jgi:3-deoxy-manno-octulosonate cytidylyltransferase (CMP-KDO synthetase)